MAEFKHISVLLEKSIELLDIKPRGIYADGTLGGGGHSELILKNLHGGSLIGIDRDECALKSARERLSTYDNVTYVHDNFANIGEILDSIGVEALDGAILDLGVSSYQLDTAERGFSYRFDSPLDMRMNQDDKLSAYEVVNNYSENDLANLIFKYGEEKLSRRIAHLISEKRSEKPIETTGELVEIIKKAYGKRAFSMDKHPAKRTFQAIRIEVNGEIDVIKPSLEAAVSRLRSGGRACVITFHSGEDRIAKQTFMHLANPCECPRDFPVCVCGKKPQVKLLTKKPLTPKQDELEANPRSRSAKVRAVEKL